METAVCNMQTTFRAWQARKLFYRLVEKRVRLYEIQLVAALCLQCTWRGYCGRRKVLWLKSRLRQRETAAIRIQKWWYDINGQFATFLLMRVLGLQDQIELRNQIHFTSPIWNGHYTFLGHVFCNYLFCHYCLITLYLL